MARGAQSRDESSHLGNPPHEAFQMFKGHGWFHISDGVNFGRVEVNAFPLVSEPLEFFKRNTRTTLQEVHPKGILPASGEDFP